MYVEIIAERVSGSTSDLFSITIISVFKNCGQDNKMPNSYDCNVIVNGLKLEAFKSKSFGIVWAKKVLKQKTC